MIPIIVEYKIPPTTDHRTVYEKTKNCAKKSNLNQNQTKCIIRIYAKNARGHSASIPSGDMRRQVQCNGVGIVGAIVRRPFQFVRTPFLIEDCDDDCQTARKSLLRLVANKQPNQEKPNKQNRVSLAPILYLTFSRILLYLST